MNPTLEQLFISTHTARIMAGDTPDLAQSAAIAAVHRAGMLDAAGIVGGRRPVFVTGGNAVEDTIIAECESAIRRAAGGSNV